MGFHVSNRNRGSDGSCPSHGNCDKNRTVFESEGIGGTSPRASNKGNWSGALCSCSVSTSVQRCGICVSIDSGCQEGSGHDIRIYQRRQTTQESLFMLEYRCHLWFFRQQSRHRPHV